MTAIKVFRFRVSNAASHPVGKEDLDRYWHKQRRAELASEKEIEESVNDFCSSKKVIDIKINNVDINYHNNAGGNTVDLIYTILYEN